MHDLGEARTEELLGTAQRLLATAWQHPVQLRTQDLIRSWGRHTLLRVRVRQPPAAAPDFVMVKASNQRGRSVNHERAGLALLAELPAVRDLVPRLYAACDNMLVLEDLGTAPTLGQLLQARAGWAEEGLLESMRGLAAVHTATRGQQQRYAHLYQGEPGDPTGRQLSQAAMAATFADALCRVGLPEDAVPHTELREVAQRMSPPAQLQCLTFYDQCPGNRVMAGDRLRFIDLELVAFRHPFLDAIYPLLGHLKCMDGLRLPAGLAQRMLATYRTGLTDGYPELVEDGRFAPELASACAVSMLWHLPHLADALERDRVVGHFLVRRRQRLLAVLDAFVLAVGSLDQLPRTRQLCEQLRQRLAERWQGAVEPLPVHPVFPPQPSLEG